MNKIIFTIAAIVVLNVLPLLGRTDLILHYKSITLIIAAAFLWLSQPAFSAKDTKSNQSSDKFSIVIILIMSSASVVAGVTEWAYLNDGVESSGFMTGLGALLLITGISIRIWAIRVLGQHFTATATLNSDHQLVRKGPYTWVRHPSYLGAFLAIIGSAVFLNAQFAIAFSVLAMSIAYYLRISVEEKMLASHFGDAYTDYKLSTKRFIPYVW